MATLVSQSGASAGSNVVGGNLTVTETHHHHPTQQVGLIEQLVLQLEKEMESKQSKSGVIEHLQHYYVKKAPDGIQGLEAKLNFANRGYEIDSALELKEAFRKMLERYELYESAQKIFAHLLARADLEFRTIILPQISELTPMQVNELIKKQIVNPTVTECGTGTFMMVHTAAMGMFYWLAEQCFVKWHA